MKKFKKLENDIDQQLEVNSFDIEDQENLDEFVIYNHIVVTEGRLLYDFIHEINQLYKHFPNLLKFEKYEIMHKIELLVETYKESFLRYAIQYVDDLDEEKFKHKLSYYRDIVVESYIGE